MESRQARLEKVVRDSEKERTRIRTLVEEKRWIEADPDRNRVARYVARKSATQKRRGGEARQGDTLDWQAAWFLPEGAQVRRAVAYVEVFDARSSTTGSGFMISPELFITNQHVIMDAAAAKGAQIIFDRELDDGARLQPTTTFSLDPDRFSLFSDETALDYAIIAVGSKTMGNGSLADFSYCIISDRPDKHVLGMPVNIIQHPNGAPKMITVRNNRLTYRTDRTLLYETDTEHGSSGSPVFNDEWEVVALHHYGYPFLEPKDETGKKIPITVNEGVRISAIYRDLEARLPTLAAEKQALLRKALNFTKQVSPGAVGKRLAPPRRSNDGSEGFLLLQGRQLMNDSQSNEKAGGRDLRVVIPIEVIVRVGAAGVVAATDAAAVAELTPPKALAPGGEKVSIDQDYTNRSGYKPNFIPGVSIPLPEPQGKLARQVAPLRPGEDEAAAGELKYEHFSLKMHKGKRIAMFTATNIDGRRYLKVKRETGEVVEEGGEGETWYKDSRISASFYIDQTFYSEWSHLFDRGHLTRRTDPTWGNTNEEAERANADTFHFTNCSPQHFRFNQTTRYWQGAEQYVLENGAIAEDTENKITVFQGPIFDDTVDLWADDVQIPSSFFKVIVWKGKQGLRSVGLVVDQAQLLSEERHGLGKPKPAEFVDVSQWRVSVKSIQDRTNLDFGEDVRKADTIKQEKQPVAGEAQVKVNSFADLLPKTA
ncbi:DNA/RNA non-specific endonuclease [Bradyrhizobium sp. CCBAU 45321]|uniref:DNA/RNA non-specific endonuclease n=1 Tax=Bradyrhizobium sp. CCBAU 45321 TaxID=1641878 RepID=UPI0023032382|nr:DNA/RNA non-specific endonuclease [Bradyrhizobium sp. CCBAU 45321]MDA9545316.1 DNA/RNA non-specific endonuclease [Bradyrhizobium sp. CCBAU 45321]